MLARFLADVVLVLHVGFVVFVALGGLLVLRWPKVASAHLPAVAWGVVIEFASLPCPLTPLEVALRRLAGEAGYSGGFIAHYLVPMLYPSGLTRTAEVALGTLALGVNAVIYVRVWARHRHSRIDECSERTHGRA
jgi:hypothetical protein